MAGGCSKFSLVGWGAVQEATGWKRFVNAANLHGFLS